MTTLNDKETPHDYRIKFAKEDLDLFKKYKIKKILEICSGDGRNLLGLSMLGYKVIGIEKPGFVDEKLTKSANITIIQHLIYGQEFPFKDQEFDCIYSYQYLNHNYKEKIEDVFKEIYRVLKKGGLFSIKITDIEQLNLKHIPDDIYEECDPEFPKIKYKKLANQTFAKLEGNEKGIPHYGFFKAELIKSLEEIGFKLINIRKIRWNLAANFEK